LSLFEFNKERFFSDHEKIILDKICLNTHLYLKKPEIQNIDSHTQEGQYTKAGSPFYWYSEVKFYKYKYKNLNREIQFSKYFYKNKKEFENIKGLELSYFSDHHKSFWDESLTNFPISYLVIYCASNSYQNLNLDASFIKMKYDNHMVSNECVELIQSETLKMLNKMYSTTT
jgi:hypothetical protein